MPSPLRAVALAAALLLAVADGPAAAAPARTAQIVPHHRRGAPHYRVNRYGYGNYVRGPDGSFGGYPAGSAGARILERKQRRKCINVPERC